WCGPCKMIAPIIGEIAAEYEGKLKVCKVNVEEAPDTATAYGIMNIPTFIIFNNGEIVDKVTGAVPKHRIISKIDPLLG
ncbi:MAG: thioredoxin family protein, partial [Candidatus Omnitrophica bacterium]|nr:thioredoxin family protein [Candidatus Omnitrophota bacterium]